MTAAAPYMPDAQGEFDLWLLNFSTLVSTEAKRYNLSQADAAIIAEVYDEWSAAYRPVTAPGTKTKVTVAAKNAAREMAEATIRPCAQIIASDRNVSPADKTALGLNPRTNGRTAIKAPLTCPLVSVVPAGNLQLKLIYQASGSDVSKRAKPPGVTHCQIFCAASPAPITDRDQLPLKTLATKSPVYLRFDAREANMPAYFAARWGVQTGGVSPWSRIVSFTVPMGG
jgi:hypothetical protein